MPAEYRTFWFLFAGRNNKWIKNEKILLAHGSGGKLMHDLIVKNFVSALANPLL